MLQEKMRDETEVNEVANEEVLKVIESLEELSQGLERYLDSAESQEEFGAPEAFSCPDVNDFALVRKLTVAFVCTMVKASLFKRVRLFVAKNLL